MTNVQIYQGDCLAILPTLEACSVQTCITSPPYFGLRDYGTATWEGGSAECDHIWRDMLVAGMDGSTQNSQREGRKPPPNILYKDLCGKCGARRVDDQIGLEPTPDEYVAKLVDVFREVKRVLRDDGTLWLNLASSYNGSGGAGGDYGEGGLKEGQPKYPGRNLSNFKPKDMIPIPWMVAMALQQDGYYLRSDIIWAKPNPMPESVTDRPTKAHEYIFLLSKSREYYYDADAIAEPTTTSDDRVRDRDAGQLNCVPGRTRMAGLKTNSYETRNKRSVWTVNTKPYADAHFATFPPDLIEPCILAGSRVGDTVLDPFTGSGTTGSVAVNHGRAFVGCELNPDYVELAYKRIAKTQLPLLEGIA